jgi:tripartite-type tricarboxylate transporter receptor subunit TctC
MMQRRALCAGIALAPFAAAHGQGYPSQPIKMIVGFTPGGGADVVARMLSPFLSSELGQAIIVDNKPGAGGNLAAQYVAKAKPDGYTIMMGTIAALAINPSLFKEKLGFDPDKDFAPISNVVDSCNVLVVPIKSTITSVRQLIESGKSGTLSYGSSGIGTAGHLAGVVFSALTGLKMLHVPYKSGGTLMTAILSGEVDCSFSSGVTAVPHVQAGKLRALGVTTTRRTAALPTIPTIAETGVAGFASNNWHGLVAPAGTPAAIVSRLNAACTKALKDPGIIAKLQLQAFDPAPMSPAEFGAFMRLERSKWATVISKAGITLET